MKPFARRKAQRTDDLDPATTEGLLDVDELDIAPLGLGEPAEVAATSASDAGASEAADFAERLGDLDRFIGGGETPMSWAPPAAARNLPVMPPPAIAPISHPRPPAPAAPSSAASATTDHSEWDPSEVDNSDDFVARLGDLDRFIGGSEPAGAPTPLAPEPSAAAPTGDAESEAQEFLDRLSDLDRFIGGPPSTPES